MKASFLIPFFLCILIIKCNLPQHTSGSLRIGENIHSFKKLDSNYQILINSASGYPAYKIFVNGIIYEVAADYDNHINFISTDDIVFRTVENFTINTKYRQIVQKSKGTPYLEPGWGFIIPLDSGWKALFYSKEIIETGKVPDTFKVTAYFKR
jgi:hypothetical protein